MAEAASPWGFETNLNLDSSFHIPTMLSDSGKLSLSDNVAATIGDTNQATASDGDTSKYVRVPDVTENSNSSDSLSQQGFYSGETIKNESIMVPNTIPGFLFENSNACDSFNVMVQLLENCNQDSSSHNSQSFRNDGSKLDFSSFKRETQDSCFLVTPTVQGTEETEQLNLDEELLSFMKEQAGHGQQVVADDQKLIKDQQVVPDFSGEFQKTKEADFKGEEREDQSSVSYDSDLEDSIQFVDPHDESTESAFSDRNSSITNKVSYESEKVYQSNAKRFRPSDNNTCPFPVSNHFKSERNSDPLSFISENSVPCDLNKSFSNKFVTPTITRSRSFSEACKREDQSPLGESRFNISLSSLLGSPLADSPLSNNPFFNDLKSILESDCKNSDYPIKLFETLKPGQPQDVYTRERNLQSKFSSLQSRYPDEVRNLSSFYRCQSAEVETERFRQLHGDNVPTSYRNYLNDYYDDQLHKIMDRVEKSVKVLSDAKRETLPINRLYLRARPLLSRKAVAMMDEWYTRNFEHPYPNQSAVDALAKAGEISVEQVKKWFANKRNRCKNTKPQPEIANMKRKRQYSSRW